jgi:hypothetical protein
MKNDFVNGGVWNHGVFVLVFIRNIPFVILVMQSCGKKLNF